jgi:hypothetical protein
MSSDGRSSNSTPSIHEQENDDDDNFALLRTKSSEGSHGADDCKTAVSNVTVTAYDDSDRTAATADGGRRVAGDDETD